MKEKGYPLDVTPLNCMSFYVDEYPQRNIYIQNSYKRKEQDILTEIINIPIRSLLESISHGLILSHCTLMKPHTQPSNSSQLATRKQEVVGML